MSRLFSLSTLNMCVPNKGKGQRQNKIWDPTAQRHIVYIAVRIVYTMMSSFAVAKVNKVSTPSDDNFGQQEADYTLQWMAAPSGSLFPISSRTKFSTSCLPRLGIARKQRPSNYRTASFTNSSSTPTMRSSWRIKRKSIHQSHHSKRRRQNLILASEYVGKLIRERTRAMRVHPHDLRDQGRAPPCETRSRNCQQGQGRDRSLTRIHPTGDKHDRCHVAGLDFGMRRQRNIARPCVFIQHSGYWIVFETPIDMLLADLGNGSDMKIRLGISTCATWSQSAIMHRRFLGRPRSSSELEPSESWPSSLSTSMTFQPSRLLRSASCASVKYTPPTRHSLSRLDSFSLGGGLRGR